MAQQNYSNHKKYFTPHHFILLPALSVAVFTGFYKSILSDENNTVWLLFAISSFLILYLAVMLRQHYALGNQNRIVRLEFRLRYFELFNQSSSSIENKLSFGQIAALRFAGEDEFKILLDRALAENLSPNEIKKAIKNWQADDMRV